MLQFLKTFLNRPVAEDFSFKNQVRSSIQNGFYVFLFVYFFGGSSFGGASRTLLIAVFGIGCAVSTLLANWVIPALVPMVYNEDRWTVWKYMLQTLFVLFCISVSNQILLMLTLNDYPTFWQMYFTVTLIGFFPIIVSVFITEQRRLRRNLVHARLVNEQLAHRAIPPAETTVTTPVAGAEKPVTPAPARIVLTSESGKEQLSVQPDQLLYIESVGNYVEVHWLNLAQPQKTVLRSTLKEVADALASYPQFLRCHRAFLVNLSAVSQTEGNARGYQLTLTGSTTKIPVSRSYLDAFDSRMSVVL